MEKTEIIQFVKSWVVSLLSFYNISMKYILNTVTDAVYFKFTGAYEIEVRMKVICST
jgi:hypothetical protein